MDGCDVVDVEIMQKPQMVYTFFINNKVELFDGILCFKKIHNIGLRSRN